MKVGISSLSGFRFNKKFALKVIDLEAAARARLK